MKKLLAVAALVLFVIALFVWWHRDTPTPHGAVKPAAANAPGVTRFRAADGVDRKIPTWVFAKGAPPRRIAGRVTLHDKPVKDAAVTLQNPLTAADLLEPIGVRTDALGQFDFGVLPAAPYDVTAVAPEASAAIEHVDLSDPTRKPPPDHLELALGDCTTSVEGTVYDASNNALPKVRVRRNGLVGVDTDAAGHYRMCAPYGDTELHFTADGYGSVILTVDARGQTRRDVVLVPEATLGVRVIRADTGEPVEDALVTVMPKAWGPDRARPGSAITDADGRARISALLPGRYNVIAVAESAITEAPVEALAEIGVANEVTLKLLTMARITGRVVDGTTPLAGVQVSAVRKNPMGRSQPVFSRADGSFTIDRAPAGDVSFIAAPYEVKSPPRLATEPGKSYDVTIDVRALAAIRGHVLRLGKPVAGVRICCVFTVAGMRNDDVTKLDGTFEFAGVTAGTYELQAGSDELGAFNLPVKVTVADGEQKSVDIELDMAGSIAGTVVDKEGKPVPAVFVRWMHQASGDLGRCMTDATGHYRCGAMTGGGTYRAAVFPSSDLQGIPYPTATGAAYPSVDVADGKTQVDGIQIAIDSAQRTITGHVVDDSGAPVSDASVKALPFAGTDSPPFQPWLRLPTSSTDADGAFTITGLAPGQYALDAHAGDGAEGTVTGIEAGATSVTITIERASAIAGKLVGFTKTPVVYAMAPGSMKWLPGTVDGQTFRVSGLRPGHYLVSAQTGIEGDGQSVDVKPGATANVTLTSHGQAAIEISVLDFRTNKPFPGAVCRAMMQVDGQAVVTSWDPATAPRSDANGHVVLDPAPAGAVTARCEIQGHWSAPSSDLTLEAGARASVKLYTVEVLQENGTYTGATFDWRVTPPRIATIVPKSPAAVAGLLPRDLVTSVDGVSVAGLNGQGVWALLASAPVGSEIKLGIQRGATTKVVMVKAALPMN